MKRHRVIRSLCLISLLLFSFAGVSWAEPAGVSGLVLDADDLTPVSGVTIVLENDAASYSAITDTGGVYFFQGIPAGDYELYVRSDDYLRLPKTVTVSVDQDAVVDFAAIPVEVLEQSQEALSAGAENTAATETWKGNWRDHNGTDHGKLTLQARISGHKINGTLTAANTTCGSVTIPSTGTLKENEVHLQGTLTNKCLGGKLDFEFEGTVLPTGVKMKGTYEAHKGTKSKFYGTFTLNKK
jgi:hypothetical protein